MLAFLGYRQPLCQAAGLIALSPLCTSAAASLPVQPLPLGDSSLPENRTSQRIADGVTLYTIERGTSQIPPPWLVTAGVARNGAERRRAMACVRSVGLAPLIERYQTPGGHPLAYVEIVGGDFHNEASAKRVADGARTCSLEARARNASPLYKVGPWRLYAVEIQPSIFRGRLFSALAQGAVSGVERTSDIARRHDALVAINGGFFAMKPSEGVVGEPAGISVIAGEYRSEPTIGRPYLLLKDGPAISARVVGRLPFPSTITWGDGSVTPINGIDRQPGQVRDCGTSGGNRNREPAQDFTCAIRDDIVALTPDAGFQPRLDAAEAVLVGEDGKIRRGTSPAAGEILLVGIGRMVAVLRSKLAANTIAHVDLRYPSSTDWPSGKSTYAVNGAPLLLKNGGFVRRDEAEGWRTRSVGLDRFAYVHRWSVLRNPRTAVGIAAGGTIWLVVAEGREFAETVSAESKNSAGLSIEELRQVMAYLGARDAINLDGGGSTALVVNGQLVSHPSDVSGERPIGDAIVITK